ncbi:MAG: GntR family transcriptional regulator [Pseudomonadota bacterium]
MTVNTSGQPAPKTAAETAHRAATPPTASLARSAFDRLRKAIVTHELRPGTRISERFLEERYGLRRAAIRDALVRLEEKQLIEAISPKKTIVAPLTMESIRALFDLRTLLEPDAAAKAAGRIDRATFKRLDDACRADFTLGDPHSEFAFLEANKAFHMAIAHAAGNRLQADFIEQVQDASMRIMWVGLQLGDSSDVWRHGHDDIIQALLEGDAQAARDKAQRHLKEGQRSIFELLASSPMLSNIEITMNAGIR